MSRYSISLDTDESDIGIQHLSANVEPQAFHAIMDFLLGKCTLTAGPLPGSVLEDQTPVSPSGSTE